ncbi:unnamed protein product [Bemisia tabaci]|uniref:BING4 C-terminal domain-containing protein n=1 Tax=Bemisia tabaci TaxID=7038 RepID=A0A9P0F011_BEMTA|nr:unnamed protein product [Bemisia tabaci]
MKKFKRSLSRSREDAQKTQKESQNLVNVANVKTGVYKKRFQKWNEKVQWSENFTEKASVLLTEDAGFLEPDEDEISAQISQEAIVNSVDITSATKRFDLDLQFGPYRCEYSRNGRHLLLAGRKGHASGMDWTRKKLHFEMNVMEEIFDISYLHQETMFAAAQSKWVYIYDQTGIELHALKVLNKVLKLEFLPYHFLLCSGSEIGYLSWLDVSVGKMVAQFNTKYGRLNIMTQNPYNAILCCGHARGVVTMWSPNVRTPVAKMLVHEQPVSAVAVDTKGLYMATSDTNRHLKIWDIRMLDGPLQSYFLRSSITNLAFSQKGLLAASLGNIAEVYLDPCTKEVKHPYLRHSFTSPISNINFCPFEDVLGVGHGRGFSSLLIPGMYK